MESFKKKSLPTNGTVKCLYDRYFSQYCIRRLYLKDAQDPILKFCELIKDVYNPDTVKSDVIGILVPAAEETNVRARQPLGENVDPIV